MQCDVTCCIFCMCNKSEYLDKERSYKNSTKEVILWFQVIFAMQSRKYWTKFRFIGTLNLSFRWVSDSMFTLACEQVLHVRVSQSKRWTINFHQWENIVRPIKGRERWFFTEWNFIVLDADWLLLIRNDYYAHPYRWINLYTHVINDIASPVLRSSWRLKVFVWVRYLLSTRSCNKILTVSLTWLRWSGKVSSCLLTSLKMG